ncbi:MAG: radical SAM protein, partial [Planctomycetota bacterium]
MNNNQERTFPKENAYLQIYGEKILSGKDISDKEALEIATSTDNSLLFDILALTNKIRKKHKGNKIKLCAIINAKSGRCSENCSFCAQSVHYKTGIETYTLVSPEIVLNAAKKAKDLGAREFSIVTSGVSPSDNELESIMNSVKTVSQNTGLETCTSLGIINKESLIALKNQGLKKYHHNLETSRSYFKNICT